MIICYKIVPVAHSFRFSSNDDDDKDDSHDINDDNEDDDDNDDDDDDTNLCLIQGLVLGFRGEILLLL